MLVVFKHMLYGGILASSVASADRLSEIPIEQPDLSAVAAPSDIEAPGEGKSLLGAVGDKLQTEIDGEVIPLEWRSLRLEDGGFKALFRVGPEPRARAIKPPPRE